MFYGYENIITYGILILTFIITGIAQSYVRSKYSIYKSIKIKREFTGFEVARMILDKNGLKDVLVLETTGLMSDCYDPKRKVIKLSSDVYRNSTISSASIAAHEAGHAIQDQEEYGFLKFRNIIIPFVNISSTLGYVAIIIGIIAGALNVLYIGIILLCGMILFQLITLPVEFDASKRASINLNDLAILDNEEKAGSKVMLNAAAITYVASLITTIFQVLRLFIMARNSNRD